MIKGLEIERFGEYFLYTAFVNNVLITAVSLRDLKVLEVVQLLQEQYKEVHEC